MMKHKRRALLPPSEPLKATVSLMFLSACILPAAAQMSFDPLSTFVPFGHKEDKNEHLARTLKNEQDLKFRTRVLARRGVVLVEFSLPTCPACDPAAKSLIELLAKFGGKVDYMRLDLNKNLGLSYKYDVPEVPAILLFKNGRLEDRFVTFKSAHKTELAQSITRLLAEPAPEGNNDAVASKNAPQYKLTY